MKKITNLKGAKALSKKEQKNINGGRGPVLSSGCGTSCPPVLGIPCGVYPNSECIPCNEYNIAGFECRIYP